MRPSREGSGGWTRVHPEADSDGPEGNCKAERSDVARDAMPCERGLIVGVEFDPVHRRYDPAMLANEFLELVN
jgi:hypothetical protein